MVCCSACVLALWSIPTNALAASQQDNASSHAALVAAYTSLHGIIDTWPKVEASLSKLDRKFATECPNMGMGSPQRIRATVELRGGRRIVGNRLPHRREVRGRVHQRCQPPEVEQPCDRTSPAQVHRGAARNRSLSTKVPRDICGDVRTWTASGFTTVPADTQQFDNHVESITSKSPPRGYLAVCATLRQSPARARGTLGRPVRRT